MKINILILSISLITSLGTAELNAQENARFPFDPLEIMKTWNYDKLLKAKGNGEEVISKINNQEYVAGLKYPGEFAGKKGTLEFTFLQDSISRFSFRFAHASRVVNTDRTDRRLRDRSASTETLLAIQRLDSIQRIDSLSRDTINRYISGIMDRPISDAPTPAADRLGRHLTIWINHGYSCQFKDYVDYSEISFSLPTVPPWAAGEFNIPAGTQIIKKMQVTTKKMSCVASLLALTSSAPRVAYSDYFIVFEFAGGQHYLASIAKNPYSYLASRQVVIFPRGPYSILNLPGSSTGYLPDMTFDDFDGDAIPEAWVTIPLAPQGGESRHLLFSILYKEPNLIFDTDDLIPASITASPGSGAEVTWQDGQLQKVNFPAAGMVSHPLSLYPRGLKYLNMTKRNNDGSVNFIGGIDLRDPIKGTSAGVLEILFKHNPGEWIHDQLTFVPTGKK